MSRDQRAVALRDPPVEPGIPIALIVERGDLLELAAGDVGPDRTDHGVPSPVRREAFGGGKVRPVQGARIDAMIECVGCRAIGLLVCLGQTVPANLPTPRS